MATPPTTDNHELPLIPAVGETNAADYADQWGTILNNDTFSKIEKLHTVRDLEANRTNYTPHTDAFFYSTDSGVLYSGDGSAWSKADLGVSNLDADSLSSGSISLTGDLTTGSGTTIWDSTNSHVPLGSLEADTVSVAGNSLTLGGSISIDHADLSSVSTDDHHAKYTDADARGGVTGTALPGNLDLNENTLENASAVRHRASGWDAGDYIESEALGTTGSETWDLTYYDDSASATTSLLSVDTVGNLTVTGNISAANDSITVAGNTVTLGASTTVAHSDLTNVNSDDHHVKYADSDAISAIEGTTLSGPLSFSDTTNEKLNLYKSDYGFGVNGPSELAVYSFQHINFRESGYTGTSRIEFDVSTGDATFNGNISAANDSITVAGNEISFGGSSAIAHADLSNVGANDHHIAHEHPGDQAASSDIDVNGNNVDNIKQLNGDFAQHSFVGTTYNIDLQDATADARYRNTSGNTIIWFRENRNVEIPGGNLKIGTGQEIQDGGGTTRLNVASNYTTLHNEAGDYIFAGKDGAGYRSRVYAASGEPFQIKDEELGNVAVQYDTDATAGVLRTPNAGMRVEADGRPSSGTGMEMRYLPTLNRGYILAYDRDTSTYKDIRLHGSDIQLRSETGLIDASINPADLRLATGQAIEDGGSNDRLNLLSNVTQLNDETGTVSIGTSSGNYTRIYARSNRPFVINDQENGSDAVQYTTSATAPGTLELTNAELDLNNNSISNVATLNLKAITSNNGFDPITLGNAGFRFDDGITNRYGTDNDFGIQYESATDELVVKDMDNGVELIRQPKAGPTKFLQGVDAGPISTAEDSFSQIINTPVTSALASGRVGHTLAIDNQTLLALEADADGNGGIQNEVARLPNSDLEVGHNSGGDVRIAGEMTENASL